MTPKSNLTKGLMKTYIQSLTEEEGEIVLPAPSRIVFLKNETKIKIGLYFQ